MWGENFLPYFFVVVYNQVSANGREPLEMDRAR